MLWNRMLQEAVVHVNNVANVPFGTTVVNDWLYWNDFKFKSVWTWRLFKKQCERYGIKLFTSIIKLCKALLTWATIHITYWKTLVFFFNQVIFLRSFFSIWHIIEQFKLALNHYFFVIVTKRLLVILNCTATRSHSTELYMFFSILNVSQILSKQVDWAFAIYAYV